MTGTEGSQAAKRGPAAAIAAAIFVSGAAAPAPACGMSNNVIAASSGFGNLVTTICWLTGFYLLASGAFRFGRAARAPDNPSAFISLSRQALWRWLWAVGFMGFPFLQAAMQPQPAYRYDGAYGWVPQQRDPISAADMLCWYLGIALLLLADMSFLKAYRTAEGAAGQPMSQTTATFLLMGFGMIALPMFFDLF